MLFVTGLRSAQIDLLEFGWVDIEDSAQAHHLLAMVPEGYELESNGSGWVFHFEPSNEGDSWIKIRCRLPD